MCTEVRASLQLASAIIESKSIIIIKEATSKQIENLSDIELLFTKHQQSNLTIIIKITDTKKVMPLVLGLIKKNSDN